MAMSRQAIKSIVRNCEEQSPSVRLGFLYLFWFAKVSLSSLVQAAFGGRFASSAV
jgi:hypothetical protein